MCPLARLAKSALCTLTAAGLLLLATVPAAATGVVVDALGRCDLASADQIERWFDLGRVMPITSYDDDPTVQEAVVECVPYAGFLQVEDFGLVLWNSRVWMVDEDFVYRENRETHAQRPNASSATTWQPLPHPCDNSRRNTQRWHGRKSVTTARCRSASALRSPLRSSSWRGRTRSGDCRSLPSRFQCGPISRPRWPDAQPWAGPRQSGGTAQKQATSCRVWFVPPIRASQEAPIDDR